MRKLLLILTLLFCITIPCFGNEGVSFNGVSTGDGVGCGASYFEDAWTGDNNSDAAHSIWTSETDTGGLLALTGNAMVFTQTASTGAYVYKTLGLAYTESWIQFTVAWSDEVMGGNGTSNTFYRALDGASNNGLYIKTINNSAGTIISLQLLFYNDSNISTSVGSVYTFTPVDGQIYTVKIYSKIASDVDTNNGIIRGYIDGTLRFEATNLDWFTYADLKTLQNGNIYNTNTNTSGKTITFDNFEFRGDDCF